MCCGVCVYFADCLICWCFIGAVFWCWLVGCLLRSFWVCFGVIGYTCGGCLIVLLLCVGFNVFS